MIPSNSNLLNGQIEITKQPNKTYFMDIHQDRIRGVVDGRNVMEQAVFKILNTERYQYPIYSWNYGIETVDLYGKSVPYVMSEIKRRISEALTWDDRIDSVDGFEFSNSRGKIHCTFVVHTIFGDVNAEKVVDV